MNKHIKQIYYRNLIDKAPVSELKVYIAAWGIHEEVEWDWDEGATLQYDETYRYKNIQTFIDKYLPSEIEWNNKKKIKNLALASK